MTRVLCLFRNLLLYTVVVLAAFLAVILAGIRLTDFSLFETYANIMPLFCVVFPGLLLGNSWANANLAMSFGARRGACFWSLEIVSTLITLFFLAMSFALSNLANSPEVTRIELQAVPVLAVGALALVQVMLFASQLPKGLTRNLLWGGSWCVGWILGMAVEVVYLFEDAPSILRPVSLTSPLWLAVSVCFAVVGLVFGVLARRGMEKAVVQL